VNYFARSTPRIFFSKTPFFRQDQAINYAQNRASFRSGEIHVFDSTGDVERTIPFTEVDRKL